MHHLHHEAWGDLDNYDEMLAQLTRKLPSASFSVIQVIVHLLTILALSFNSLGQFQFHLALIFHLSSSGIPDPSRIIMIMPPNSARPLRLGRLDQ